ncbi:MAG: GEVED domain-containing protein, partial [Flavisolibacter sp.]
INSMSYDPYNHILYYVYSLTPGGNSRKLMKYDFNTETITELLADINTIGIPTVSGNGAESGAGAFYNGALYLGVETSNNSRTSGREATIWKVDFNGSNIPYRASQVFAVAIDGNLGGDNCLLHDWADFVMNDGILYNFDAAENDRNGVGSSFRNQSDIYHLNMLTGALISQYVAPGAGATPTWYPGQPSVGWNGTVYSLYANGGAPNTPQGMPYSLPYIAPYNAGNIGTKTNIVSTPMYTPATPSLGDAGEAYRPMVDFGDAPASYDPVAYSQAVHEYNPLLRLGTNFDKEWVTRGQSVLANLDNFDDGLPYVTTLYPSLNVYLTEATVFNNTGVNATVGAWLDFNADGQFQAAEGITMTVPSNPAPQNIFLYFPNGTNSLPTGSYTYLRVRITTGTMTTANPTGYFADGEVEDYRVPVNMFPLRTQYVNFDVKKDNNKVSIKWNVNDEVAGSVYEIERSEDRHTWTKIHNKLVMMDAVNAENAFIDSMPLKGSSYYRLKTLYPDKDGKISLPKQVDFPIGAGMHIAPNPTAGNFKLTIANDHPSAAVIRVIDMSGREIHSMDVLVNKGDNSFNLDLRGRLINGVYTIQIKINQKIFSQKLVINK